MEKGETLVIFSIVFAVYIILHVICIIHDIRHNRFDFTTLSAIIGGILVLILCISFLILGLQILIKIGM